MTNALWNRLVADNSALSAGWHLTRNEVRADFVEDIPIVDAVGYSQHSIVTEIRRCLATNTFEPHPPIRVDVPKGSLGIRPGSLINLNDRIVLYGMLRLIAKKLDQRLPTGVYSYRVKKDEDKRSLFEETDIVDLPFFNFPFLKKSTIAKHIDPFEPWYALWPEFDAKSREAIDEYPFLSISDISAYFENISLQILRNQLSRELAEEPKIVNTIMQCFEAWAERTEDGFRPLRGIPQGTSISSFFGNFFLLPLDQAFEEFGAKNDIRYFRYMDDVRIFSKDEATARKIVFHMDRVIRSLHLNVQSAKTKILRGPEIHQTLIDERIERLKVLKEKISVTLKENNSHAARSKLIRELKQIGNEKPKNREAQKLIGSHKPIKDLSLRAYRMWISCHVQLGDNSYLNSLFHELQRNPDHRLTRTFVNSLRTFPRSISFAKKALGFMESDLNIYPLQEAELLHAIRYSSRIPLSIQNKTVNNATNQDKYFYIRVQSCNLLTRFKLSKPQLDKLSHTFDSEGSEMVLTAIALPLGQLRDERNSNVVRRLVHHPNIRVALLGKHIRHIKNDQQYSFRYLDFVFEKNADMRICDHLGLLSYISQSRVKDILLRLQTNVDKIGPHHPAMDIRERLYEIGAQCERNLERLAN